VWYRGLDARFPGRALANFASKVVLNQVLNRGCLPGCLAAWGPACPPACLPGPAAPRCHAAPLRPARRKGAPRWHEHPRAGRGLQVALAPVVISAVFAWNLALQGRLGGWPAKVQQDFVPTMLTGAPPGSPTHASRACTHSNSR
jgi:hypothetical protein